MRISLKVPLSPYSGYGNDGIGISTALLDAGADLYLAPGTLIDSPLPARVANLLTKEKLGSYDLVIHHLDPDALYAEPGLKDVAGLLVGWTMWEYSNFLNCATVSTLRERLEAYDVMVAYDQVTAGALAEVYDGKIIVLQGGFMPENYPYIERDWFDPDHFRFCMVGALHERKDPFVTIEAFRQLKAEHPEEFAGAELHLKTNVPGLHSAMNEIYKDYKIRVYTELWDKNTLDQFYSQMHCLVAPSRGEGKNMPALEMQSSGGVVIATNWGGHTQWLNPDTNYAIDYTLHPMDHEFPRTLNARASVEHLKELMLHVYRNRAESKRKGELASALVAQTSSWEAVVSSLLRQLGDIEPKIKTLAAMARAEARRGED